MTKKKIYVSIGERIRTLRKQKGMTQEGLARVANISYISLVKIEQSKTKQPAFQTVYKIARALETDLNAFVEGTEVEHIEAIIASEVKNVFYAEDTKA